MDAREHGVRERDTGKGVGEKMGGVGGARERGGRWLTIDSSVCREGRV